MGFLDALRRGTSAVKPNITPVKRTPNDEFAFNLINYRLAEVAAETSARYSKIYTLKRFIEGDQWDAVERKSRVQPVTDNICAPVVEKYVSFFTRTIPRDR